MQTKSTEHVICLTLKNCNTLPCISPNANVHQQHIALSTFGTTKYLLALDKQGSMHQQPHRTSWTELSLISSLVYFQNKGKSHGSLTGPAIIAVRERAHPHTHPHNSRGVGGHAEQENTCSDTNMELCLLHV